MLCLWEVVTWVKHLLLPSAHWPVALGTRWRRENESPRNTVLQFPGRCCYNLEIWTGSAPSFNCGTVTVHLTDSDDQVSQCNHPF
jgi:hypothetical protein